jgi:hypothetical protein
VTLGSRENYSGLNHFFDEAAKEISVAIHEYFSRILRLATANRYHLENASPIGWTRSLILRQVARFMGVDEKFDDMSPSKDDGRLVQTTARIALGSLDETISSDFVLPGWVDSRRALMQALGRGGTAESLPPLTKAETLEWIKQKEFWIRRAVERQIENDSWDGILEAGVSNVSVLDVFDETQPKPDGKRLELVKAEPTENHFVREAATWSITFEGEVCRLKTMIGLDYISVLLEHPGHPIRALQLQGLTGGLTASCPGDAADEGPLSQKTDEQGNRPVQQSDFGSRSLSLSIHAQ